MPSPLKPMLNTAVKSARKAGDIILQALPRLDTITITEKQHNDFVTNIDHEAEATIIDTLHYAYPDHGFIAEESGETKAAEYVWIIDPLDGTTNFFHGIPHFAVSIALRHQGRLVLGVIFDPVKNELFCAMKGEGAVLNDRRIRVSGQTQLERSLLATGWPFRDPELFDHYVTTFAPVFKSTCGIRRPGAASLDLAYVAAGRMDGYWEIGLNIWDVAAGALIVQEAGGLVGDIKGGNTHLQTGDILAATPKVFRAFLQAVR